MKYCKNCNRDNDKSCQIAQTIETRYHGMQTYFVWSCSRTTLAFKENPDGFSFHPIRNANRDCTGYKRKWWKFWL